MNLYDVLAGQGTTHFERLFSQRFAGGAVQTLTGQPPLTFKADGTPLISWSMLGNGSQSGTPTPDAPIQPTFCGVRTGNLFDKSATVIYYAYFNDSNTWIESDDSRSVVIPVNGETQYTLSVPEALSVFRICEATQEPVIGGTYYRIVRASSAIDRYTFTTRSDTKYIIFQGGRASLDTWFNGLMLNLDNTALPYEPFGYKIPITCAEQTVPVYLGQTQTVRRVGKLVLNGTESWSNVGGQAPFQYLPSNFAMLSQDVTFYICSHYKAISYNDSWTSNDKFVSASVQGLRFKDSSFQQNIDDFKAFLAAQYAAGTPVTVWYVLAEPTTGIVNEPLAKIGDYADELHSEDAGVTIPTARGSNTLTVGTELQPSSMTITFK